MRFFHLFVLGLAGFAGASFGWPMKYFRGWRWEHVWIGQSLTANVIYPMIMLISLWPLFEASLTRVSPTRYLLMILLGVLWGVGGIAYGLSLVVLGLSFTYSVLFSVTTLCGALLPMWMDLRSRPSNMVAFYLGLALCVCGTLIVAHAGAGRSKQQKNSRDQVDPLALPLPRLPYVVSLVVALAGGVFSSSMGLALALNADLVNQLLKLGVSPVVAPLIVWVPLGLGSGLVAISYGLRCAFKSGSLQSFYQHNPVWNWALVSLMGVLGFGGMLLYGLGASGHGHPPENVAWATYMTFFILSGNCIGLLAKEWKGCQQQTYLNLFLGILLLLAAIGTLAVSQ
jgi:L-rhamnose-H+ transport protein